MKGGIKVQVKFYNKTRIITVEEVVIPRSSVDPKRSSISVFPNINAIHGYKELMVSHYDADTLELVEKVKYITPKTLDLNSLDPQDLKKLLF